MTYKRHIDSLPIVPKDAKEFNVVCHYCIVGCGYKANTWPTNKQGGTAPDQNAFGVDLASSRGHKPSPGMRHRCTTSSNKTAKTSIIVIKPDNDCVVNSGLGSMRGARMAEMSYFDCAQHAIATPDRSDGVALRADAADKLGRCTRSRGARHRRRHQ